MTFLNAYIYLAQLCRKTTIIAFPDDTRDDIYSRFCKHLGEGKEAAILHRLMKMVAEDGCEGGITAKVEIAPFGITRYTHSDCNVTSVEDICEKLAELSILALKTKEDPWK